MYGNGEAQIMTLTLTASSLLVSDVSCDMLIFSSTLIPPVNRSHLMYSP